MIYLIHLIRNLRKFIKYPLQFLNLLFSDLKKDRVNRTEKKDIQNILIIGLPKSGTTLIEWVLSEIGYVNMTTSCLRVFDDRKLEHPHNLSDDMLKNFPLNKPTFLKRHSEPNNLNLELIKKYNFKTIISFRNLKDVMISRYLHMITDKSLPQHDIYNKLNLTEGFKTSLIKNHLNTIPIQDVNNWIKNWKKEIESNKNFCELNYDDYNRNKEFYIKKLLNFLKVDSETLMNKIIEKHQKHLEIIKKNNLTENLNSISPQTYNRKKSSEIKKLLDNDAVNNFYKECVNKYCST